MSLEFLAPDAAVCRPALEIDRVGKTFQVAKTTTGASGKFTFKFTPPQTGTYAVSTPKISKIEIPIPTLDPPFAPEAPAIAAR